MAIRAYQYEEKYDPEDEERIPGYPYYVKNIDDLLEYQRRIGVRRDRS
jgi:hypothetical protein